MSFYDRNGRPLRDVLEWGRLHQDPNYVIVEKTQMPNGDEVSTVWVGINLGFIADPPIIFETMIFDKDGHARGEQRRYATEAEARAGHAQMVAEQLAGNVVSIRALKN